MPKVLPHLIFSGYPLPGCPRKHRIVSISKSLSSEGFSGNDSTDVTEAHLSPSLGFANALRFGWRYLRCLRNVSRISLRRTCGANCHPVSSSSVDSIASSDSATLTVSIIHSVSTDRSLAAGSPTSGSGFRLPNCSPKSLYRLSLTLFFWLDTLILRQFLYRLLRFQDTGCD